MLRLLQDRSCWPCPHPVHPLPGVQHRPHPCLPDESVWPAGSLSSCDACGASGGASLPVSRAFSPSPETWPVLSPAGGDPVGQSLSLGRKHGVATCGLAGPAVSQSRTRSRGWAATTLREQSLHVGFGLLEGAVLSEEKDLLSTDNQEKAG